MAENKWKTKALCLYRWIRLQQNGVTLESLLMNRGFYKIALYGFNEISKCVLYELANSQIIVDCIIDMKGRKTPVNYKCIYPDEVDCLQVDAIIVTFSNPQEVMDELEKNANCEVVSFEELIYEL
ncbi:MAG: hypothetical protein IKO76_00810 [Butyrivibrio sp.]|nr:hypothetical protein [Butyrivibrio sp.]